MPHDEMVNPDTVRTHWYRSTCAQEFKSGRTATQKSRETRIKDEWLLSNQQIIGCLVLIMATKREHEFFGYDRMVTKERGKKAAVHNTLCDRNCNMKKISIQI